MNSDIRLTDQEQRLLDMVRRHAIDAEVAVQLGVPVGDVKDRIERLKAKLGVETRAELVTWSPDGRATDEATVEAAPQADGATAAVAPTQRKGMSRRRVLAIGGAGLALVAGGAGAVVALRGKGQQSPATADQTPGPVEPTATPGAVEATINASVPATALARLTTMRETTGQWTTRDFVRDAAIPWHTGIFFMNPDSGVVTGYQVAKPHEGDIAEPQNYTTDETNSAVVAYGRDVAYLFNRQTQKSWEFSLKGIVVKAVSARYLLIGTGESDQVRYDGVGPLWFTLLRTDGVLPTTAARLDGTGWNGVRDALVDDEGATAWVWTSQDGVAAQLSLLKDGSISAMGNYPIERGYSARVRWHNPELAIIECSSQDATLLPYSMVVRISESSLRRVVDRVPGLNADVSPDEKYIAYTETEVGDWRGQSIANEARGVFRNVVVKGIGTGATVLRIRSADLGFGDGLSGTRWLGDSRGIVVMVKGGDDESPYQRRRMAIARLDSDQLEPLPIPAGGSGNWYTQRLFRGALPVPNGGPDLFSIGHYELLNARTGQFTTPDIGEDGPAHLAPWGRGRDASEMRFALPHGGHDGSEPSIMLPPRVERPPIRDGMRMRVVGAGDCLNLRAYPSTKAEVRGCFPDGTLMEGAAQPSSPSQPGILAEGLFTDEGEWVAVHSEDGKLGWASADYLEWV